MDDIELAEVRRSTFDLHDYCLDSDLQKAADDPNREADLWEVARELAAKALAEAKHYYAIAAALKGQTAHFLVEFDTRNIPGSSDNTTRSVGVVTDHYPLTKDDIANVWVTFQFLNSWAEGADCPGWRVRPGRVGEPSQRGSIYVDLCYRQS